MIRGLSAYRSVATVGVCLFLYWFASLRLFAAVHETSSAIVDELFHLPQGAEYCRFEFGSWNPKITTPPGLYLISAVLLGPWGACTTYALRFVNLIFSAINLVLFFCAFRSEGVDDERAILRALGLAILPPLYFFSHIYYTECVSLTFVLLFMLAGERGRYASMVACGLVSILIRQTNVVWIGMHLGHRAVGAFYLLSRQNVKGKKRPKSEPSANEYSFGDLREACAFHLKTKFRWIFRNLNSPATLEVMYGSLCIVPFAIFVLFNGSIVVGDKEAHVASLHLPQIFYFALFCGFFGFASVLKNAPSVCEKIYRFKYFYVLVFALCAIVVRYDTLVHPYLLADNRHYTFYIWNKFYGKYWFARYIAIPFYLFALTSMAIDIRKSQSFGFILFFVLACGATMCLQRMIEVRYFLIPFVVYRLKCPNFGWRIIAGEILFYIVINFLYFRVFFAKEIRWEDFEEIQRLVW